MMIGYGASKAALDAFTAPGSLALVEDGIRVNCSAPDHTRTPGNAGIAHGLDGPPQRSRGGGLYPGMGER